MESNILARHEIELITSVYENKKCILIDCHAHISIDDTFCTIYKINASDFKTCELFLKEVEEAVLTVMTY